jgi:phenylpropionate dioxygenase-like ring-hydroxylating dioxygenase large terminal subunit
VTGTDATAVADEAGTGVAGDVTTRFRSALRRFWHPVCTEAELEAARHGDGGVLGVELLGEQLVVADVEGGLIALRDRCLHRSTRLSVGWVCGSTVQCAYHGWRWDGSGRCVEIPSMPDGPIPGRARIDAFEVQRAHGLVWVRLEAGWPTTVPANPAWGDPALRVVMGTPYVWPTSTERRVENFIDLSHFAWIHDQTLSTRSASVPPIPEVRRESGELRFEYDPPALPPSEGLALIGWSAYRVIVPSTVDIEFDVPGAGRRHLWMTACPLDADDTTVRCYWTMSRSDDQEGDDGPYMEFQQLILDQDKPVIVAQQPPNIPFQPGGEISVRTDRVSIELRRWLTEVAATSTPDELARVLGLNASSSS